MTLETMNSLYEIVEEEWPGQVPPGGLAPEMPIFYGGIGLDSVDGATLILSLEEKFGIEIDPETISMDVFETVGALCDFIELRTMEHA
ncbi:MAG: acyl carrier protein [Isosphaeraceae bacterium]|nr:acyl carrier protein [Isosphaeraceae bacterium]